MKLTLWARLFKAKRQKKKNIKNVKSLSNTKKKNDWINKIKRKRKTAKARRDRVM